MHVQAETLTRNRPMPRKRRNPLGGKIKNIREALDLSQEEFGRKLRHPVQQATVSRWECGRDVPEPDSLEDVALLGGILVSTLLDIRQLGDVIVVGYVEGGGRVVLPKAEGRMGLMVAERPTSALGEMEAVQVRGGDLHPYEEGTILYVKKNRSGVPDACLNPRAVSFVELSSGERFVCKLLSAPRGHHLLHLTTGRILAENAKIRWASRVTHTMNPDV